MIIVDSHAHLNMDEFDADRDLVIKKAFENGIGAILCPIEATEEKSISIGLDLTKKYSRIITGAGIHPHLAKNFTPEYEQKITTMAKKKQIKAVGEIGLDFHYNFSDPADQIEVFRRQMDLAEKLALPVIIHSRDAANEVTKVIEEIKFQSGGVLHCFTEELDFARIMLDAGFYISFSGILTYPSAVKVREAAVFTPLDRILVETDSPYLPPIPFRRRVNRNEPVYVKETAKYLAELKNITLEDLATHTTENFEDLFQFEIPEVGC
ncbi:MAG: TatD family hydrolase [Candidatus Aminicenantes bacterium]|nr:TatD family hydrolase [Candidatus Aminicenantes bacterium]